MEITGDVYKIKESKIHKNELLRLIKGGKLNELIFFDCKPLVDHKRYEAKKLVYLILEWTCIAPQLIHYIVETRFFVSSSGDNPPEDEVSKAIVLGLANYVDIFNERVEGLDLRQIIPDLNKSKLAELRDDIVRMLNGKV